jgi:hypothetical protein
MRYNQGNKVEVIILGMDAEIAFDSVRWAYKAGCHECIIKAFQALYDRPSARIKINGDLSNPFI